MKKITSLILAAVMLLSLGTSLTSCSHECVFSDKWSSDDESHWHECKKLFCEEMADVEDHTWSEGTVITPATQEKDGKSSFTCTVCDYTKEEKVAYAGMTKDEWDAAFDDSVFKNFSYEEKSITSAANGVSVKTVTSYKLTDNAVWYKISVGDQSEEGTEANNAKHSLVRKEIVKYIEELTPYSAYKYDPETKTYKATKAVHSDSLGTNIYNISLKFKNGKLVEIEYNVTFSKNSTRITVESIIALSDYGNVVLN